MEPVDVDVVASEPSVARCPVVVVSSDDRVGSVTVVWDVPVLPVVLTAPPSPTPPPTPQAATSSSQAEHEHDRQSDDAGPAPWRCQAEAFVTSPPPWNGRNYALASSALRFHGNTAIG